MKLRARQKYDYRDLERGEAQLMRVGHALWRDRRKLGDTVSEREGINEALVRVFGRPKENTEQHWPRKGPCGSRSFGRLFRSFAISLKWFFLLRKIRRMVPGARIAPRVRTRLVCHWRHDVRTFHRIPNWYPTFKVQKY